MSCINDEILQLYIDGELESKDRLNVEKHLRECFLCREKIAEQTRFVDFLKSTDSIENQIEIPVFVPLVEKAPKKALKPYLYPLVAACCGAFLYFSTYPLMKKPDAEKQYLILYDIVGGYDSNLPFMQQELEIYVLDENGNIVESN